MPAARSCAFVVVSALLISFLGCHGCSDEDDDPPVIPPAAPTNLAVTLVTSGRVRVCWTDNSTNEAGFLVERSPDGLAWTAVATVPPDTTCHVDRGLLPLTPYFYRVSATGSGGSAPTATVSPTTLNLVWQAGAVGGGPTARLEHSAIYDGANRRMVVYGGDDGAYQNDTWALDLSTATPSWSALAVTGATAPSLANHSAIYDSANKRMIVFGGLTGAGIQNEVWELTLPDDGISTPTWTQLSPTPDPVLGTPAARFNHSAVYDAPNRRMILFGGSLLGGLVGADAWALNLPLGGGTPGWTRLADGPAALASHSAVFDDMRGRMLVFGGSDSIGPSNAVHSLSLPAGPGTPTWSTLLPASAGPPGPRVEHAAVYDAGNERMTVFGGSEVTGPVDETWLLPLVGVPAFSLAAPAPPPPPARMSHSAIYDPVFERMVVFSGDDGFLTPIDDLAFPLGF